MLSVLAVPEKTMELLEEPADKPLMVTALVALSLMNTPAPALVFPVVAVTELALVCICWALVPIVPVPEVKISVVADIVGVP